MANNIFYFKGTLVQIWKSNNMLVLYENNMLKISH